MYAIIRAEEQTPWLLALGAYFLAGVMTITRYQPKAYRTRPLVLWGQFAINLAIAATLAIGYLIATNGNVAKVGRLFS